MNYFGLMVEGEGLKINYISYDDSGGRAFSSLSSKVNVIQNLRCLIVIRRDSILIRLILFHTKILSQENGLELGEFKINLTDKNQKESPDGMRGRKISCLAFHHFLSLVTFKD